jgi:hypothetical protein
LTDGFVVGIHQYGDLARTRSRYDWQHPLETQTGPFRLRIGGFAFIDQLRLVGATARDNHLGVLVRKRQQTKTITMRCTGYKIAIPRHHGVEPVQKGGRTKTLESWMVVSGFLRKFDVGEVKIWTIMDQRPFRECPRH